MGKRKRGLEEIELLSEDVQEILGAVPPWIVKWGITLIFIAVVIGVCFTFIIKYPDVINSKIIITSLNPPSTIVSKSSGKIDRLFVMNGDIVKPMAPIALLENTATYEDVYLLKKEIMPLLKNSEEIDENQLVFSLNKYNLGPVQGSFVTFYTQCTAYHDFLQSTTYRDKIISFKDQLTNYQSYMSRLLAQAKNLHMIVKLSENDFGRDSALLKQSVITPSEFDKSQQSLLQTQNSFESLKASIVNTQMQINQTQFQIIDMVNQQRTKKEELLNQISAALKSLHMAINEWEKSYILYSPIEGKVSFIKYWAVNQYVMQGTAVCTIIPSKSSAIIGRMQFPVAGSGKVFLGQNVNVKLDNFPFQEYGILNAKIESISLIPETDSQGVSTYLAEVSFPLGLETSYRTRLPFKQELQGVAEIVTSKHSLFERLLQPINTNIGKIN